jgi:integrase
MFAYAVAQGVIDSNPCDAIVDDLIDRFVKACKNLKGNRTYAEYERNLKKDVSPVWGCLKVKDITRRDVIALQDRIIERGALNQSRQVFKIVRRMFNYAVEEGMINFSPCAGIKPKVKAVEKDRFLSDEEINIFWSSLPGAYMSDQVRRALQLVLVTGQRPGEVAGAHSSEIDGDWWIIPGERTKNKRPHRVFLSPLAKQLFGIGRTGYLLPSLFSVGTEEEAPITPLCMAKALRRSLTGREQYKGKVKETTIKLPDFTPHDLRRTAATHMGKLGFSGIVCKVLNHTDNTVTAIYNQYDFDKEKKRALLAWSRKIGELTSGKSTGTVVPFSQAG